MHITICPVLVSKLNATLDGNRFKSGRFVFGHHLYTFNLYETGSTIKGPSSKKDEREIIEKTGGAVTQCYYWHRRQPSYNTFELWRQISQTLWKNSIIGYDKMFFKILRVSKMMCAPWKSMKNRRRYLHGPAVLIYGCTCTY